MGFPAWVLGVRGLRDHLTPDPHLGGGYGKREGSALSMGQVQPAVVHRPSLLRGDACPWGDTTESAHCLGKLKPEDMKPCVFSNISGIPKPRPVQTYTCCFLT